MFIIALPTQIDKCLDLVIEKAKAREGRPVNHIPDAIMVSLEIPELCPG